MPQRDQISWNSLITGYLRVGEIELAHGLFNEIPERDLVSCNAMIDGYGKSGKCELAEEVFRTMHHKDVVTWTSMISGYVCNHHPKEALGLFREMLNQGIRPDAPALVSVLSAIADLGFVEEGKWVHTYISTNKIKLSSGFIASALIDMYAKCHEALEVFLDMSRKEIKPDEITFLGLLSACNHGGLVIRFSALARHSNVAIGEVLPKAINLAPEDSSCYILLSNLYAKVGRWDDVGKVRLMMNQRGVQKIPGSSSVLVNGTVHEFLVGKEMNVKHSVERKAKKKLTYSLLSEKMALAFGLINRSKGAPIHIVKNLRICHDCHSFIKLVSGVYNCRIVVRDQNRFHQFENGSCSCKDFW
ncbi:hypothetical protein M0R45_000749 [Rubus argutus]